MRQINRVLAALLSLAVIVAGILLVVEIIADRINGRPALVHWRSAYRWAHRTSWNQGAIRMICVGLLVVGIVLLFAELKRAQVSRLAADPSQAGAEGIDTAYTRRGTAAAVRSAVADVDGVRGASVTVKRRKINVTATAAARDKSAAQNLREPVTAAAQQRVDALQLRSAPSVSVHVTPRSS